MTRKSMPTYRVQIRDALGHIDKTMCLENAYLGIKELEREEFPQHERRELRREGPHYIFQYVNRWGQIAGYITHGPYDLARI